ncbi:adhesion G protein-coupled receptor L2-like, partial [Stegodyphus dumicola]|uniref:adhesion G protein-coupled receptor L2-like n=1 Tax=Stegodyphus dumicola TaxID=202533 RepID=UPI0015B28D4C
MVFTSFMHHMMCVNGSIMKEPKTAFTNAEARGRRTQCVAIDDEHPTKLLKSWLQHSSMVSLLLDVDGRKEDQNMAEIIFGETAKYHLVPYGQKRAKSACFLLKPEDFEQIKLLTEDVRKRNINPGSSLYVWTALQCCSPEEWIKLYFYWIKQRITVQLRRNYDSEYAKDNICQTIVLKINANKTAPEMIPVCSLQCYLPFICQQKRGNAAHNISTSDGEISKISTLSTITLIDDKFTRTSASNFSRNSSASSTDHTAFPDLTSNTTDFNMKMDVTSTKATKFEDSLPFSTVSSLAPKPGYCMPTETPFRNSSIKWPETKFGETAEVLCPRGTFGTAFWICNAKTGKFEGYPQLKCEEFSCVKPPPRNKSSACYTTYMVEYFRKCANKSSGEEIEDLMKNMRQRRRRLKEKDLNLHPKPRRDKTTFARNAFGVYDRFLDKDVAIWKHMGKEKRISMSMDLIKETEETAWLIACSINTTTGMKEQNLAMQIFPLNERGNKLNIVLNSKDVGYVHLPGNLKAKTEHMCKEPIQNGVTATYKNIEQLLSPANSFQTYTIASDLIGISLGESNETYTLPPDSENFRIVLYHAPKPMNAIPKCVFLNWNNFNKSTKYGVWDTNGCRVINSSDSYTECECDHLTNFAILMDFAGYGFSEIDEKILSLLSLILSCFSMVALTLTIALILTIRSLRSRRNTITCNLAICLLCMNILVQSGLQRVGTIGCMIISGLLQYVVLAAFFWMLVEGLLLYRMVILVFETKKMRLPLAYGLSY